jgi:hypothetical protein
MTLVFQRLRFLIAITGLFALFCGSARAYIEALYPLAQFLAEAEVIAEGVIEKSDKENKTCIVKVKKSFKGKCDYERIQMNMGGGQFWHSDVIMRHLVEGAPAVIFYDHDRRAEIYINRFFCQLYGDPGAPVDKAWWNYTHTEIHCNRTYCGPVDDLVRIVKACLAGKDKPPAADPRLPAITKADMKALAPPGQPQDPASLPAAFVKRPPAKEEKPREPDHPENASAGVRFELYEGTWDNVPDFDALKPIQTGVTERLDHSKHHREENYGLRLTGFVKVPKDGVYTFTTLSDDGSILTIGKLVVVNNDGLHAPQESGGEINLKAGQHPVQVTFFQAGGEHVLKVFWEGPDLPKEEIPASAFSHQEGAPKK